MDIAKNLINNNLEQADGVQIENKECSSNTPGNELIELFEENNIDINQIKEDPEFIWWEKYQEMDRQFHKVLARNEGNEKFPKTLDEALMKFSLALPQNENEQIMSNNEIRIARVEELLDRKLNKKEQEAVIVAHNYGIDYDFVPYSEVKNEENLRIYMEKRAILRGWFWDWEKAKADVQLIMDSAASGKIDLKKTIAKIADGLSDTALVIFITNRLSDSILMKKFSDSTGIGKNEILEVVKNADLCKHKIVDLYKNIDITWNATKELVAFNLDSILNNQPDTTVINTAKILVENLPQKTIQDILVTVMNEPDVIWNIEQWILYAASFALVYVVFRVLSLLRERDQLETDNKNLKKDIWDREKTTDEMRLENNIQKFASKFNIQKKSDNMKNDVIIYMIFNMKDWMMNVYKEFFVNSIPEKNAMPQPETITALRNWCRKYSIKENDFKLFNENFNNDVEKKLWKMVSSCYDTDNTPKSGELDSLYTFIWFLESHLFVDDRIKNKVDDYKTLKENNARPNFV